MSLPLSVYKRMPKRMPHSLGFDRYVLYFDGEDDYIEIPDSPSLNPTKAITVEAMIKPVVDMYGGTTWTCIRKANNQYLLEPGDAGTNYWAFGVNIGGTFYRVDTDEPISIKQWHHFVGLYDSSKGVLQIWVDGKLRGSRSLTGEIQVQSGGLLIGRWGSEYFTGYIAFVRIYNRALSESEIRYNLLNYHNPVRDGLVLWLDFEEGHGDKAYDKSDYGNHGTIYGGAKWIRVRQYELRAEVGL